MSEETKKRGFAALSPERMRQIASEGGHARKRIHDDKVRKAQPKHMENTPRTGVSQ